MKFNILKLLMQNIQSVTNVNTFNTKIVKQFNLRLRKSKKNKKYNVWKECIHLLYLHKIISKIDLIL